MWSGFTMLHHIVSKIIGVSNMLSVILLNLCISLLANNLALVHRGQRETEERRRPLHIGRWKISQVKELKRMVLGDLKTSTSPLLPIWILKVYIIEALTVFSHVHCPDGLSNTLLHQGHVLEDTASIISVGKAF